MSVSALGSGEAPTIVLYAGIEANIQPAGENLIKLGTLEASELTDLERLLAENAEWAAHFASALAVTIQSQTSGAPSSSKRGTAAFTRTREATNAAPELEPAPEQRKRRKAGKQRSGNSKRARRPSVENHGVSNAPPNLRRAWLSMIRSGQGSRNQITKESQGTDELTSNGQGNQSLGKFAKSHPRDSDQDPPTERKAKSERILPNAPPNPTPPPLAESAHFPAEAHSNRLRIEYIPTPQYENEEHVCPFWGRHAARTAHPEGRAKFTPFPCGTCDWCRKYKKSGRAEQYWASNPSPTATVLTVEFPDIESADRFAKLPGHRSRIPGIRKHIGFQQADGWALDEPCLVRILWDTVATGKQQKAILRHANKSGATAVNLDVRPVSKSQFRDWLPDLFTIVSDNGKRINASRFSSGWAQGMKLPDDWRNGLTRRVTEKDEQKWTSRPFQGKRAKAIRESWIHHYKMSRNPLLPPEERQKLEQAAQARLERARYLNTMDWLHRWEILKPLHIEATREFVEAYLRGENPDVREWQKKTRGPKALPMELARWLNGERESEPAIWLAADRLGYNTPLGPHIDKYFLRELTAPLGPLQLQATEESGSAPWEVPEPMAA